MMMEMSTAETRGDERTIAPSSTAADLSVIGLMLEGREASEVILSCIKLKYQPIRKVVFESDVDLS